MMTTLIGAVINVILDPIFIFVFDMGVRGAAIANCFKSGSWCHLGASFFEQERRQS